MFTVGRRQPQTQPSELSHALTGRFPTEGPLSFAEGCFLVAPFQPPEHSVWNLNTMLNRVNNARAAFKVLAMEESRSRGSALQRILSG